MRRAAQVLVARRSLVSMALTAAVGTSGGVQAVEIQTGNPDINLRLDNTVRYTLGLRAEGQDDRITANGHYDEGDLKFKGGDLVQNRVDLLTELDMTYQNRMGFRVSAASWYDDAYRNDNVKTNGEPSSYDNDNYSGLTQRYYRGPSGEILDAFVFSRFNVGDVPLNLRVGKHTVFWGEGLLFPGHAISYSQAPIDGRKAAANPGSETKEIFLPVGQLSGQAQLTDKLSLAFQYFYDWESTRAPEGGTYFGAPDFVVAGPDRFFLADLSAFGLGNQFARRIDPKTPGDAGNWGVAAKYNVDAIDATIGLYYRVLDDYNPGGLQTLDFAPLLDGALVLPKSYRFVYVENTKLYGVSMSRQVGPASVGVDLSYREGTGLNTPAAGADGKPAIGNTWHLVANSLWLLPQTALFDTGNFVAEIAYSHLDKVTHNEDLYFGNGYAACDGLGKWDGCSTRDFVGIAANMTPQWLQVFPNVDFEMPLTLNVGLYGNSPTGGGSGNQGASAYSIGVRAIYDGKHEVTLRYADQYAHSRYDENNVLSGGNSSSAAYALNDRGYVSLTLKSAF